jgi:hypothetical protein
LTAPDEVTAPDIFEFRLETERCMTSAASIFAALI